MPIFQKMGMEELRGLADLVGVGHKGLNVEELKAKLLYESR